MTRDLPTPPAESATAPAPDRHESLGVELAPGERLVWSGRPTVGRALVRLWPAFVMAALWNGVLGLELTPVLKFGKATPVAMVTTFALVDVVALGVLVDRTRRLAGTRYAITDRRAILRTPGLFGGVRTRDFEARELANALARRGGDGWGDLILDDLAQTRGADLLGPPRFLAIARVREVEQVLRGTLARAKANRAWSDDLAASVPPRWDDLIRAGLDPDEPLVWVGQPCRRLRPEGRPVFLIFGLLVFVFQAISLDVALKGDARAWGALGFSTAINAPITLGLAWSGRFGGRVRYALTDRRAIVATARGPGLGIRIKSYGPADLGAYFCHRRLDMSGSGDLIFSAWRPNVSEPDAPPEGFLAIDDVLRGDALLRSTLLEPREVP